mmetsp:Transcript_5079/g.13034  ORF Transcript_5079/g.13034 Transcript_5079/m.13034 type:complete len:428 (+) Transcript_5079:87-1370(+)
MSSSNSNLVAAMAFAQSSPTDWAYIAEGALNLVLRYTGTAPELEGYILRVRKDNPEAAGGKADPDPWAESLRFADKMIVPIIGRRYVQKAHQVPLAPGFMDELAQVIESSRPEKRRVHPLDTSLQTALLMTDNTSLPGGAGPSVCFELKLKWGFVPATCPFVTHEVKKRVNRFVMHQQLKFAQGKLDTLSRYSPMDLFSYEPKRVRAALDALVATPQNNFRMFVNGVMVYPDDHGHGSQEAFASVVSQYPNLASSVDSLLDSLAAILVSEPLLDRIRTLQTFDDCDIEGALPAYQAIVDRGEAVLPLADGETLLPREAPTTAPSTPEEQHETVRRFMLSCTAKDCSTMIVLKPAPVAVSTDNEAPDFRSLPPELEGERVVTAAHGFNYSIAAVDLDPKPLAKMPKYFKEDAKIAEHYAKLEAAGELK